MDDDVKYFLRVVVLCQVLQRLCNKSIQKDSCFLVRVILAILSMGLISSGTTVAAENAGGALVDLGVPVAVGDLKSVLVGPDENGRQQRLYFNFAQLGEPLFLVQANPEDGTSRQFDAKDVPPNTGAWGFVQGPDGCMYLGTWDEGLLLRFDPSQPDKGIQTLGRPAPSETYIWSLSVGSDGRVYGGTYPNAKLIAFDTQTDEMYDLGRMSDGEQYCRHVAASRDGWVYGGVGPKFANFIGYHIESGRRVSMIDEDQQIPGWAITWIGADKQVYGRIEDQFYHLDHDQAREIDEAQASACPPPTLEDGRVAIEHLNGQGHYKLKVPHTDQEQKFSYQAMATGVKIWSLVSGPDQCIYGSSSIPLRMFRFDPTTGETTVLGNPTKVGGQIYSFSNWQNKLFIAAYPLAYLSVYDPQSPWDFGEDSQHNPQGFGPLGDGHYRPQAMLTGKDGLIYIASKPNYGEVGGGFGVFDPEKMELVQNIRPLVIDHSLVSIAQDTETKAIFVGSSIEVGAGADAISGQAVVVAWSPQTRKELWRIAAPGPCRSVQSLAFCSGRLFATLTGPSRLVVLDPDQRAWSEVASLEGEPHVLALKKWSDGMVYGLTDSMIFRVNPGTLQFDVLVRSEMKITSEGMAINASGIYFGAGSRLKRFEFISTPMSVSPLEDKVGSE